MPQGLALGVAVLSSRMGVRGREGRVRLVRPEAPVKQAITAGKWRFEIGSAGEPTRAYFDGVPLECEEITSLRVENDLVPVPPEPGDTVRRYKPGDKHVTLKIRISANDLKRTTE